MSTKILLPLSALAACPMVLLITQSKNPDEAPVDVTLVDTPSNPEVAIGVANQNTVARPEPPRFLSERLPVSSPRAISNEQFAPPAPPSVPTVRLERTGGASLEQIVSRSIAPTQLSSGNAQTGAQTAAQTPVSTIAALAAVPQTPHAVAAPETIATTSVSYQVSAVESQPSLSSVHLSAVPNPADSANRDSANRETESAPDAVSQRPARSYSFATLGDSSPVLASRQLENGTSDIEARQIYGAALQPDATRQKAQFFASDKLTVEHFNIPKITASFATASIETPQPNPPVLISPPVISTPSRSVQVAPAARAVSSTQTASPRTALAQATPAQVTSVQASPAQTAPTQPSVIGENYTLGAGDRITVSFFNVPEYNGEHQIAADGSINLPVVGGASLEGLTLQEAGSFIASLYEAELAHPRVTVNLTSRRPLRVSVIGEVGQPGLYTLEPDQSNQVIQAIQAAGGFTQSANLRQVQIRRSFRGQTQTIAVNVRSLLESGELTQNLMLQDGDSLYIPAAETVDLAEANQLANSNLTSTTSTQLKIALVGEVNHPGAYQLPSAAGARATLTQAIQTAGGITPTADVRQVQIRRTTRMGGTQTINIDLWQLLQSGDLNQDLILQDGDTIVLAKAEQLTPAESIQLASTNLSPTEIQVNLMGEVSTPGSLQLPSNITLNQAIMQAGGLNPRARRSVQLIRMSPTGTLTRRTIELDFDQDANTETNPVLQNNDMVVIGRSTVTQITDGISNFLAPILRILPPFQSLF